jgi:hypothetical protein
LRGGFCFADLPAPAQAFDGIPQRSNIGDFLKHANGCDSRSSGAKTFPGVGKIHTSNRNHRNPQLI